MLKGSEYARAVTDRVIEYMTDMLGNDRRLCDAIIPKFEIGCRRLTPGVGYLESLTASNVRVVTDSITKITAQGAQTTSGELISPDIIICATGFDVSFCPRFPVIGREGNLQDIWTKALPRAYMSCAIPGLPNYFSESYLFGEQRSPLGSKRPLILN